MLCVQQTAGTATPLSASRKTAMICGAVSLVFFIGISSAVNTTRKFYVSVLLIWGMIAEELADKPFYSIIF